MLVIEKTPYSKYTPPRGPQQRRTRSISPVLIAGAVEGGAVRPALHVDDAPARIRVLVRRLGLHRLPGLFRSGDRVDRDLAQVALLDQRVERLRVLPLVREVLVDDVAD